MSQPKRPLSRVLLYAAPYRQGSVWFSASYNVNLPPSSFLWLLTSSAGLSLGCDNRITCDVSLQGWGLIVLWIVVLFGFVVSSLLKCFRPWNIVAAKMLLEEGGTMAKAAIRESMKEKLGNKIKDQANALDWQEALGLVKEMVGRMTAEEPNVR